MRRSDLLNFDQILIERRTISPKRIYVGDDIVKHPKWKFGQNNKSFPSQFKIIDHILY